MNLCCGRSVVLCVAAPNTDAAGGVYVRGVDAQDRDTAIGGLHRAFFTENDAFVRPFPAAQDKVGPRLRPRKPGRLALTLTAFTIRSTSLSCSLSVYSMFGGGYCGSLFRARPLPCPEKAPARCEYAKAFSRICSRLRPV